MPTLTDKLHTLQADLATADETLSDARDRKRSGRTDAGREVLAPLNELYDAIRTSVPRHKLVDI